MNTEVQNALSIAFGKLRTYRYLILRLLGQSPSSIAFRVGVCF